MKDCKKEKTKTIHSNPLPMEKKLTVMKRFDFQAKKFFMPSVCKWLLDYK